LTGGTISADETWSGTYLVASIAVAADVTLTIQPGTVVKFAQTGSMTVEGTLAAAGTAALPIYFTSLKDDTVGGDSNGDGNASSPTRGDWNYLYFG
ncbi:hypothetical protein NIL11_27040, partial [Klebsiella pneumoniae]|uniref:hypothetical protein n=1 Tax=Klebsiella pneumoniae TaxID=573 RepID=UPI0021F7F7B0